MQAPYTVIQDLTKKYIKEKEITHADFAERVTLETDKKMTGTTIGNFLGNRCSMNRKNLDAIEDFLKMEGKISALGRPTEIKSFQDQEEELLSKITGIKRVEGVVSGNKELDAVQNEWQTILIIAALAHDPHLQEIVKKRTIGQAFPTLFPQLSKL